MEGVKDRREDRTPRALMALAYFGLSSEPTWEEFADFHALRHTYITNLARNGDPLVTAQKLARHSTLMLTAQRYTHIDLQDQKVAVDRLPSLQRPLQRAGDFSGHDVATDGNATGADPNEENPEIPSKNAGKSGSHKRRDRDSNPGYPCGYSGFQDRSAVFVTRIPPWSYVTMILMVALMVAGV